jgi:endonuclease G
MSRPPPWRSVCKHASTLLGAVVSSSAYSSSPSKTRNDSNDVHSLPSPISPIRIFRPNSNLEIAFDVRTRNPVYVLEKLTFLNEEVPAASISTGDGSSSRSSRRRPPFYEETSLPEAYRSRLSHYRNSGYDRGHMAPAADYPHATNDTFTLTNVSPQNHSMNISIWHRLERWTRRVTSDQQQSSAGGGGDVYVVTGPLWLPQRQTSEREFQFDYPAIGRPPILVSVPTHFFKVVVVVDKDKDQITKCACFVIPNTQIDSTKDLQDYVVHWTDLEAVSGLQFFPQWATDSFLEMANAVGANEIMSKRNNDGDSGQPLLLTDGTRTTKRMRKIAKTSLVEHLCSDGTCQR